MNSAASKIPERHEQQIVELTRTWLERAVIGLNLCPFAKAVHARKQIRYAVSAARTTEALCADLLRELQELAAADPTRHDTTLLIHPYVLGDFLDYNDFLDVADAMLEELALAGVLQIASFHPHYQFAGTAADDPQNNTNRSPFPILHLLREDSVAAAVDAFPDPDAIPERNIALLQRMGQAGWQDIDSWSAAAAELLDKPGEN